MLAVIPERQAETLYLVRETNEKQKQPPKQAHFLWLACIPVPKVNLNENSQVEAYVLRYYLYWGHNK